MSNTVANISDFGDQMTAAIVQTTADGLQAFSEAATTGGIQDSMLEALAAILVAFAVVWGIWLIAKKIYRGAKAVR